MKKSLTKFSAIVVTLIMLVGVLTGCGGSYDASSGTVTIKKDAFNSISFKLVSTDGESDGYRDVVINGEPDDLLDNGFCVIHICLIDRDGTQVYANNISTSLEITSEGTKISNGGIHFLFEPDHDYVELYVYYGDYTDGGVSIKLAD